jgi:hypothetical protein
MKTDKLGYDVSSERLYVRLRDLHRRSGRLREEEILSLLPGIETLFFSGRPVHRPVSTLTTLGPSYTFGAFCSFVCVLSLTLIVQFCVYVIWQCVLSITYFREPQKYAFRLCFAFRLGFPTKVNTFCWAFKNFYRLSMLSWTGSGR